MNKKNHSKFSLRDFFMQLIFGANGMRGEFDSGRMRFGRIQIGRIRFGRIQIGRIRFGRIQIGRIQFAPTIIGMPLYFLIIQS